MRVIPFWGTIYKIHDHTGIDIKDLCAACPPYYCYLKKVPRLRWAALLALFYLNWITAIICLVIEIVVPVTLRTPEHNDYRNMEIMRKYLYKKIDNNSKRIYNCIVGIYNSPPSFSSPSGSYFSDGREDSLISFVYCIFLYWKFKIISLFKK